MAFCSFSSPEQWGWRGGLVVERRTPEREVGVRSSLRSPCCVLGLSNIYLPKVLVIPWKRLLCPNMTEKLFTGMSSKNKKESAML